MRNYRLRVVLLSLGALFGFGSGIAHMSHRHDHCHSRHARDYHADCDREVDEHHHHHR